MERERSPEGVAKTAEDIFSNQKATGRSGSEIQWVLYYGGYGKRYLSVIL